MTLDKLKPGEDAYIRSVGGTDMPLRKHMLDMGLTPGTEVTMVKAAPMGDPLQLTVRGYELTLRKADAAQIVIEKVHDAHIPVPTEAQPDIAHPHTGETGVYHVRTGEAPLPDGVPITFALAGNQNSGKTTLFNQLTGSNQHVGNFPGVTVDRKDGKIRGYENAIITDLPGIYSMSPYTGEEVVTRQFLLDEHPCGIINIVDATNIQRNLYLTMQLIEMGIPMVLALNMMDEVQNNGGTIQVNRLEEMLGIPVVPISAAKNEGIEELIRHAVHVAKYRERPGRQDFCDSEGTDSGALHRCIHSIEHLIEGHAYAAGLPLRFAATKVVEDDKLVLKALKLSKEESHALEHIITQMEQSCGKDRHAALADMRFSFIDKVCSATVVKPHESKEHARSTKLDRILTGKYTAIPAFVGIMALVFWLTFGVIGTSIADWFSECIDSLIRVLDGALTAYGLNPVVQSLVIDGVCAGVGGVIGFMPVIMLLFFFLSILEDTGYMARVAFFMDKLLRKVGLSGRSFVPMLIGFGCSVPAIMATRTLPSDRDRKMTILLTPFMSCPAKLPIYGFFAAFFFPKHAGLVTVALYLTGILVAVVFAFLLKRFAFKGEPVPFVMELPNYRLPGAKNVLRLMWDKAKDFITRAFTVIFVATVLIWFLQTFDGKLNVVADSSDSLLAAAGGLIAPIFKPLGFGDWRLSTALITGFMAKESVVSTLTVLVGEASAMAAFLTPMGAVSFLVFCLLYTPCVAAIASVKRELGTKWAVGLCLLQCAVAWIVSFAVYMIGGLLF